MRGGGNCPLVKDVFYDVKGLFEKALRETLSALAFLLMPGLLGLVRMTSLLTWRLTDSNLSTWPVSTDLLSGKLLEIVQRGTAGRATQLVPVSGKDQRGAGSTITAGGDLRSGEHECYLGSGDPDCQWAIGLLGIVSTQTGRTKRPITGTSGRNLGESGIAPLCHVPWSTGAGWLFTIAREGQPGVNPGLLRQRDPVPGNKPPDRCAGLAPRP